MAGLKLACFHHCLPRLQCAWMEMPQTQNVDNPPAHNGLDARTDTFLPHWGWFRRNLHALCKRSRLFNHLISSIEMRADREEAISLPQYIGLCPTGQCNAQCEFCSVTVQRTGIIKRQIALENIERFLEPSLNTVWMYGIEGNGEPTLYKRFDDLVALLTGRSAKAYLITNGSRLSNADIPLLLKLENINFSLNAATADTHNKVMKLEGFDAITSLIRDIVQARGDARAPKISASFVVTNDNILEVSDFLRLCDSDLGVDEIFIRPLSELANEAGTVEDLRGLVPLERDLKEMISRVNAGLSENKIKKRVFFDSSTFRSYRAEVEAQNDGEALEAGQMETEIKLPSKNRWQIDSPGVEISWPSVNKVVVRWEGPPGPYLLRSYSIPCKAGQTVLLPVNCQVRSGILGIGILSGKTAGWIKTFEFKKGETLDVLEFDTGHDSQIRIVLYSNGADNLDAEVDWIDAIQKESSDPAFETGKTQDGRMTFHRIKRFFFGTTRYYCQKPWADLGNFSVDGRVDVCCIATGASQTEYSLGNFINDDFQSIWNGEQMRNFRRTVNSGKQLPPCERCPLHFAYQGPLLDPQWFTDGLGARIFPNASQGSFAGQIRKSMLSPVKALIHMVFFRGFR